MIVNNPKNRLINNQKPNRLKVLDANQAYIDNVTWFAGMPIPIGSFYTITYNVTSSGTAVRK